MELETAHAPRTATATPQKAAARPSRTRQGPPNERQNREEEERLSRRSRQDQQRDRESQSDGAAQGGTLREPDGEQRDEPEHRGEHRVARDPVEEQPVRGQDGENTHRAGRLAAVGVRRRDPTQDAEGEEHSKPDLHSGDPAQPVEEVDRKARDGCPSEHQVGEERMAREHLPAVDQVVLGVATEGQRHGEALEAEARERGEEDDERTS